MERSIVFGKTERADAIHHYFFGLDGLRALALLVVMFHHYLPALLHLPATVLGDVGRIIIDLGGLGVDLFFALSGFLITGILIDSKHLQAGRFFGRFYWRRSLRIFPAYYSILIPALFLPKLFTTMSPWWFLLYLRNWRGSDPASDGLLGHLWSLAVEEQFYIGWAVAVFLCPKKFLAHLIVFLSLLALPFRWWMIGSGYDFYDIIRFTFSRVDGLLLGGLVAVAWRSWPHLIRTRALIAGTLSAVGFSAVIVAGYFGIGKTFQQLTFFSWTAVFFASIVALALQLRVDSVWGRVLGSGFLKHIAKYSYAMYLWHLPVRRLVQFVFKPEAVVGGIALRYAAKLSFLAVVFLAVYLVARISWKLLEQPALRFKDLYFNQATTSAYRKPMKSFRD